MNSQEIPMQDPDNNLARRWHRSLSKKAGKVSSNRACHYASGSINCFFFLSELLAVLRFPGKPRRLGHPQEGPVNVQSPTPERSSPSKAASRLA